MTRRYGALWLVVLLPVVLVYPWLVHYVLTESREVVLRIAVATAPLLALLWWALTRARSKTPSIVLIAGAAIFVAVLEQRDHLGLVLAYGVPHAVVNLGLMWWFGRTLGRSREPLVTGFARKLHGNLSTPMQSYTRRVTVAWTVFFAAQVVVSATLFIWGTREAWSFFVNVLNMPLVALMFVLEYSWRIARHRDFPHATIWQGIRAFADDMKPGSAL